VWTPAASSLPDELRNLGIRVLIRDEAEATARASADFGNMSVEANAQTVAVLYPSCPDETSLLCCAPRARGLFPVSTPAVSSCG
jgi:DNA mismatch repair protein MutH